MKFCSRRDGHFKEIYLQVEYRQGTMRFVKFNIGSIMPCRYCQIYYFEIMKSMKSLSK